MSFLPEGYAAPKSGANNYMNKYADGANKIRALGTPVFGYEFWADVDGKRVPTRVKAFKDVPLELRAPTDNRDRAKYFWSFLVWNYQEERAQILTITQASIRDALKTLDEDPDWGDLREYDVVITKTGKDLETSYQVNPKPKSPFDKKGKDIPSVNLEALFTGDDPFASENIEVDVDEMVKLFPEKKNEAKDDVPMIDFSELDGSLGTK